VGQKGKNIVVVVTLDTKGEEALYLKKLIKRRGHHPLVMDIGIRGAVPFQPDFTREEVALATGRSLEEIRKSMRTHSDVLTAMAMGAKSIIQNLIAQGKIDGLLSIGGGLGTTQASMIMPDLPLKVPKLILSTVAFVPGAINSEMVSIDQAMMQSASDLWGLNSITRMALQRAAGAICGMAEEQEEKEGEEKPRVAISTLGVHTYVDQCKSVLIEKGYEPIVFHSVGTGALEKLIKQGYFMGTLDLSCYELVSYVCGGIVKGGEEKFTAACEKGIPQVIGSGGLDFFPLFASQPIPAELRKRTVFSQGMVNLIKTTPQEQEKIATLLAEKINKASAPIVVLVPLGGFSRLDRSKEMPFYEPGAGRRFVSVLKEKVSSPFVEIEEIEAHINDPIFAERATALLLCKMG
jgi:uncharacterized protein (UPF0261 family)